MEIILLFCSSGVAGLYTYIYLDYLSVFDTEKPEIKKMFSILFSLISIGVFLIVFQIVNYITSYYLINIVFSFIVALLIIKYSNKLLYPCLLKNFRKKMNEIRVSKQMNPLNDKHAIDTILQKSKMFYLEKYNGNVKPVYQGILLKHELTNDLDSIFSISPTPIIKNQENVIEKFFYQPKNTDDYYIFYSLKD
ncbi:TPA: hypothetical protein O1517_002236 [Staphylococcus aureus]|nr:hypothetical protein [Staphylococcus aureus]HCY6776965.1 hypothetical protein [Staphylococcus aureus]HCY7290851.1 hypothetical protein [Staphylococcus aureus]HCY7413497.1 hypothetical protein [Staphylococcus aureus]HDD2272140.1 hypothetical protein [Staphylococcus aureus]